MKIETEDKVTLFACLVFCYVAFVILAMQSYNPAVVIELTNGSTVVTKSGLYTLLGDNTIIIRSETFDGEPTAVIGRFGWSEIREYWTWEEQP
jgi:hypothetical protein